jgi:hypothetical protein
VELSLVTVIGFEGDGVGGERGLGGGIDSTSGPLELGLKPVRNEGDGYSVKVIQYHSVTVGGQRDYILKVM